MSNENVAPLEWFDSHCHLQDEYLPDTESEGSAGVSSERFDGAIRRGAEAGVSRMVCVGTGEGSSREAVSLVRAMRQPGSVAAQAGVTLWATVGLHPHDAKDGLDPVAALLAESVSQGESATPVVVAVGECGLDYHYDHSPRAMQRQVFADQIALARQFDLALVIHTREAWDDTFDILATEGMPERTVVHCFTGGPDEARRALDAGATLSFSGIVTFKNATDVQAAAELCPMDRFLVETDSPFLTPVPHRGATNEPSFVPLVGVAMSALKGVPVADVAAASRRNTESLFSL